MMARRGRQTEPEPDPIRPHVHLSGAELAWLKAQIRAEELARAAAAAMADRPRDPDADQARALDIARVGKFIFEALGEPLAPARPAKWLPRGGDEAERLQFAHTLAAWERQMGDDEGRLRSALVRVAGHYPGADWRAMKDEAKAKAKEADKLAKRAEKTGVALSVAKRLACLAKELREEVDRDLAFLARRGWKKNVDLACRDFAVACVEIFQLLRPGEELHAKRDSRDEAAMPANGLPAFFDKMLALKGDRFITPSRHTIDWERTLKRALEFHAERQKAASR